MKLLTVFRRRRIASTLLVIAASAACVRLGIWQLDRLAQRRSFNAHVTTMRSLAALELPTVEDLATQEYRLAEARGEYDYEHQVTVRNQVHEGAYGFHLITPLRIRASPDTGSDSQLAILVDRGWIPAAGNQTQQDWRKYDELGSINAVGIIRLGHDDQVLNEDALNRSDLPQEIVNFWLFVDVRKMGEQLPYAVLPVYLQLDGSRNWMGGPIAAAPVLDLSEGPHLGYTVQWFGFAALLLVGYPLYVSRKEGVNT